MNSQICQHIKPRCTVELGEPACQETLLQLPQQVAAAANDDDDDDENDGLHCD